MKCSSLPGGLVAPNGSDYFHPISSLVFTLSQEEIEGCPRLSTIRGERGADARVGGRNDGVVVVPCDGQAVGSSASEGDKQRYRTVLCERLVLRLAV